MLECIMDMGKRLKAARKYAGLTQQQLADRIGIKQQSYQKAECGVTKMPENLRGIADVCGVEFNWLLTGDGLMVVNKSEIDKKIFEIIVQLTKGQKESVFNIVNKIYKENEKVICDLSEMIKSRQHSDLSHA